MGTVILAALLSCILFGVSSRNVADDLYVSISIEEGEHSRDSNSSSTTITITGHDLVYDTSYRGFRASSRKPVHKQIRLKDEDITKLKHLIAEDKLLTSGSIDQETGTPGRYVILTMNLRVGKKKSSIKIAGMSNKIENVKLYKIAQALIDEINEIIAD